MYVMSVFCVCMLRMLLESVCTQRMYDMLCVYVVFVMYAVCIMYVFTDALYVYCVCMLVMYVMFVRMMSVMCVM